MYLRNLKIEDAKGMYDWMHDTSVTKYFDKDFSSYTIDDCIKFINNNLSYDDRPLNVHFAIIDGLEKYSGTVSLKNIDYDLKTSEFAIILMKEAQGSGLAIKAFNEIIDYAFNKLNLDFVYFSCKKNNLAANKFYSKTNAKKIDYNKLVEKLGGGVEGYNLNYIPTLLWYIIIK